MATKLNGATLPTVIVTAILLLFGLSYHIDGKVNKAHECAIEASERAVRVEAVTEQIPPRLDRMEDKIDRLLERGCDEPR